MSDTLKMPVYSIREILDESKAETYIIAVSGNDKSGYARCILATKGKVNDVLELLASIVRRTAEEHATKARMDKKTVIDNFMKILSLYVSFCEDENVKDVFGHGQGGAL